MKTRSITYEEFLKTKPCWLQKENTAKLMEEIGRSKEKWTAQDVLSINHKGVLDTDKLWVILYGKLLSKKQIGEVFISLMREAYDDIMNQLKKEKDARIWNMFSAALFASKFSRCLNDVAGVMLDSKQSLIMEYGNCTTLKEIKVYLASQVTSRYDALREIIAILLDQNRLEQEASKRKSVDIDTVVNKYLAEFSLIAFVYISALKTSRWTLLSDMHSVSHGIVAKYTGNPIKILQTITTVVNRPERNQPPL